MSDPTASSMLMSVYNQLTVAEGLPLIGVVPSAIKGVVALAQMVSGLALLLLTAPFYLLCQSICSRNNCLRRHAFQWYADSAHHVAIGASLILHSLINIETLGMMQFFNNKTFFLPLS